jgi:hypothetical protein
MAEILNGGTSAFGARRASNSRGIADGAIFYNAASGLERFDKDDDTTRTHDQNL